MRRISLVAALALLAAVGAPAGGTARELTFYHTHTGERLQVVYARDGHYLEPAIDDIGAFLADFRTGDSHPIDPALLDLIFEVRVTLGGRGTFEVISAYRSPQTNEMLRSESSGVAKNSLHLVGKAIDVRLTGVELVELRDTAIGMQRGGVGYFPASGFVHLYSGRVRRW
jgi:uncharacterized protein YcbK (DUF882 family)